MSRSARWAARLVWLKGRAKANLPDPTEEEKRVFAMGFNMGWKMRGARDRRLGMAKKELVSNGK